MNLSPHHYSMIGLAIDIIGAFFLAVEAIKLENFRKFRESVLLQAKKYTLSPRLIIVEDDSRSYKVDDQGNKLYIDDSEVMPNVEYEDSPSDNYPGFFMALHNVAGFLVLVILNAFWDGLILEWFMKGIEWTLVKPWYFIILILMAFIFGGIIGGLWVIGEIVHVIITNFIKLSIKAFSVIEKKTANGIIGIIGFCILMIGFCLQFYGAFLSGSVK